MDVHVAIIGSGFTGIGAAIRLQQHGITDVVLLERATELGGTWRDNDYPGSACDVPSHLYSFSFAQNASWSRRFSQQPEIQAYLQRVSDRHDITTRIRFRHALRSARWDEAAQRWRLVTTGDTFSARVLLLATGALSDAAMPTFPGLDDFTGPVFHSSQWRHDVPLAGHRVAVIGTGASAIQFVPAIQPQVHALTLFQRTPPWIVPRRDRAITPLERAAYNVVPGLQTAVRAAIYGMREATFLPFRHKSLRTLASKLASHHLAAQVRDPALRAKLTPDYGMGCKRILVSDNYYPALTKANVHLETSPIARISANAIETVNGASHPADVIIMGTGFRPTDPPLAPCIVGRNEQTLATAWRETLTAYNSTTVHGFPNLFVIPGPNAGLGHTSMIYMIESQLAHFVRALKYMAHADAGAIEPRADAQAAYVKHVDDKMRDTVWMQGGCASWYLDRSGRNSALWPDFTWRFRKRVAPFDRNDYHLTPKRPTLMRHSTALTLCLATLATFTSLGVSAMTPASAHAQSTTEQHAHTPGMTHPTPTSTATPTQGGQSAFAAIAEIAAMLQADASTDWTKVNIDRLRLHLADMDLVTLRSRVASADVAGGAQFTVRGSGDAIGAIKRMTAAHGKMVANGGGPRIARTELPDGVRLVVTADDPSDSAAVARIRGLGFIGLMTTGDHHGAHHLALARGDAMADHGH